MAQSKQPVDELLAIMQKLRDPESGCPWDKVQDFESIVPYTIEETYELADAIFTGDMQEVKDELGDLLFQVVFYAQLGDEQGAFNFSDVAQSISDKLIRRHPHVFAKTTSEANIDLSQQWEQIKAEERKAKGLSEDKSILANVPQALSPLMRANKLQKKCSNVGFDWQQLPPVVDKIQEEIEEVLAEVNAPEVKQDLVEEEIGDLLFAVVNLARHCRVNPETALIKANNKFEKRFRQVEQLIEKQGTSIQASSLAEMEAAWVQIKKQSL